MRTYTIDPPRLLPVPSAHPMFSAALKPALPPTANTTSPIAWSVPSVSALVNGGGPHRAGVRAGQRAGGPADVWQRCRGPGAAFHNVNVRGSPGCKQVQLLPWKRCNGRQRAAAAGSIIGRMAAPENATYRWLERVAWTSRACMMQWRQRRSMRPQSDREPPVQWICCVTVTLYGLTPISRARPSRWARPFEGEA